MAPFDPYHKWLGIPKEEQPPNHYCLLGIRLFEDDPDVIEHAADQRMSHLRTLQTGQQGLQAQQLLNEISTARYCLLDEEKREQYDQTLRGQLQPAESKGAENLPSIQVTQKEKTAKEQQGLIPTAVEFLESIGRAFQDVIGVKKDDPTYHEMPEHAEPTVPPPLQTDSLPKGGLTRSVSDGRSSQEQRFPSQATGPTATGPTATGLTKKISNKKTPATKSPQTKSPQTKSPQTKSPQTKSPAKKSTAAVPTLATEKLPKLNSAEEYFKRGGVSYVLGKYDRAIADFSEAIRTNPKYAEAYEKRGYAWQKKSDRDQAMADLEKAYELYQERE